MRRPTTWSQLRLAILAVLFLLPALAAAQDLPEMITYQGYLTNTDGDPANGTASVTFRLYDQANGGTALWQEAQPSVVFTDGVFSVHLGAVTSLEGVSFDRALWLGVSVAGSQELAPRVDLEAVPYSLRAGSLDDEALEAGDNVTIQRNGDALQIAATGSLWSRTASNGNVYYNDGNVGVGTNAPRGALHVAGETPDIDSNGFSDDALVVEEDRPVIGIYGRFQANTRPSLVLAGVNDNGTVVDKWGIVREYFGSNRLHFTYGLDEDHTQNPTAMSLSPSGPTAGTFTATDDLGSNGTPLPGGHFRDNVVYAWAHVNADGSVAASDGQDTAEQTFTVTVTATVPGVPILAAPEDGADGLPVDDVELVWEAVPGTTSYDLDLATVEDFSSLVTGVRGLTDTTWSSFLLDDGTTYYWRIRAVNTIGEGDFSASFHFSTAMDVANEKEAEIPEQFALHPNYPNPFNPTTTLSYDLPEAARVRLTVYDVFGREVAHLVDAAQPPGHYELRFEAPHLASGTYFYRIRAGSFRAVGQMLLVK